MAALPLYLDACVVLNVYATRRFNEILVANRPIIASSFVVGERVAAESGYVRNRETEEEEREAVDLQASLDSGVLALERLESDAEMATFVALAAVLDDGEAETGTLAFHRGGSVATDDLAAIRVLRSLDRPLRIVRTSQLLKGWAEEHKPPQNVLRQVLNDIRERARFLPDGTDPLREWWLEAAA